MLLRRLPATLSKLMKPKSTSLQNSARWARRRCKPGPNANTRSWSGSGMRATTSRASKKKLHWQTRFGKIEFLEQTYRRGRRGPTLRPFCESAGVGCRSYSLGLERALTDFGADESFAKSAAKVKEHYRITIPESGVRRVTQKHAARRRQQTEPETKLPAKGVRQ